MTTLKTPIPQSVMDSLNDYIANKTPVAPYKVFTGLLTQSGGDVPNSTVGDETIFVGVSYTIVNLEIGDNLIPYGAPNNNIGTSFICNQDVAYWGNPLSQLSYNNGAPVVTILENTIGNVWFTYVDSGNYRINSNNLFIQNKLFLTSYIINPLDPYSYSLDSIDSNIRIRVGTTGSLENDVLSNTPIEIRVYN